MQTLKQRIRHVPDFPKPGILFYDVTTLLKDREGFRLAVDEMARSHEHARISRVVPIEEGSAAVHGDQLERPHRNRFGRHRYRLRDPPHRAVQQHDVTLPLLRIDVRVDPAVQDAPLGFHERWTRARLCDAEGARARERVHAARPAAFLHDHGRL